MKSCCICKKKQKRGNGSFFRVPNDDRRLKWTKICGLDFSRHAIVCMDHFPSSAVIKTERNAVLLPDAVPIIPVNYPVASLPADTNHFEIGQLPSMSHTAPTANDINQQLIYLQSVAEMCCETPIINDGIEQEIYRPSFEEICSDTPVINDAFEQQLYFLPAEKASQEAQTEISSTSVKKLYIEKQMQTEPVTLTYVEHYFKKIQSLETEVKELKCNLAKANAAVDAMRSIFTEGQVRKLMVPGNINWRWPDISSAICLHAAGPRAYNHLYKKGFPLPHVSTLQRWCQKVNMNEGILTTAIQFMREITDLEPEDKVCVLVFDEMKVVETFEYDGIADAVRIPANYVQVVIARGLRKSWKQPVFYGFDVAMTANLLEGIVRALHRVGFPVVAMVCDMGPKNRKLWRTLKITPDKPWFPNPIDNTCKIFAFADAPHLLKLVRNHFLDTGLVFNKSILTSRTFVELLNHTSASDVSITHKISNEHLAVKGPGRQKVKLAAQLFSSTSANAIRRCYSTGIEMYNPIHTADFVELVNDWFDVHNTSMDTYKYPGKEPFGIALKQQEKILKRMTEVMRSPMVPNKNSLEIFQRGIIMSNNALKMLLDYVSAKFKMNYICTSRLNQDVLEHFFGAIRSKGGLNDHPSPKDFKYRLRKYILARNTEHLTGTGNVGYDTTEWLNSTNIINNTFSQYGTSSQTLTDSQSLIYLLEEGDNNSDTLDDLDVSNFQDMGALQEDALEYICGYIIHKLNLEEYTCHESSYTWVDQVSKGFLKKPTWSFVEEIKKLENVFRRINGLKISHKKNLHKRLLKESKSIELSDKIKSYFFKCRIHFRVRHLNKRLKIQKCKQRIMGNKKMIKINL